jgi:hypothetical protein
LAPSSNILRACFSTSAARKSRLRKWVMIARKLERWWGTSSLDQVQDILDTILIFVPGLGTVLAASDSRVLIANGAERSAEGFFVGSNTEDCACAWGNSGCHDC